jgi:folate-dependent phosphoribosylglycinamide formyltransferase PurN
MKRWIAFFSQTGSEIANVANKLVHCPNVVVTNKPSIDGINNDLLKIAFDRMYFLPNKPTIEEYETVFSDAGITPDNTIITLHGYLRIVPPEICVKYNIINCHPALVSHYPELKGFDPQKRSVKYDYIGTTLHKVIAEVDEGEILSEKKINNNFSTVEEIIHVLKLESQKLWIDFLLKSLYN